jgi:hypothetical protein
LENSELYPIYGKAPIDVKIYDPVITEGYHEKNFVEKRRRIK